MITLHRFPISHFSEKGRALLDFKGLDYEIRDYTLGLPQRKLVKLSGQRQVPVIEHAGDVVHDSTRIAHYLDEKFPDRRRLIPLDEPRRAEVLKLEDEIDRVFGVGAPLAWFQHALVDRDHLDLLAIEVHGLSVRGARVLGGAIRTAERFGFAGAFIARKLARTRTLLKKLSDRLAGARWLVGDEPTLADVAAAGLTLHLEFPKSKHLAVPAMAGRGVPGFADDPSFAPFFSWRRRVYEELLT